jgi:hypothetical protein
MPALDYIPQPDFSWTTILRETKGLLEVTRKLFNKSGKIEDIAFCWPSEIIEDDQGNRIYDVISMILPEEAATKQKALRNLVVRASAKAVVVIEQKEKEVTALLEGVQGTIIWKMPIQRRGDRWFLGKDEQFRDAECLGLLWQPKRAQA